MLILGIGTSNNLFCEEGDAHHIVGKKDTSSKTSVGASDGNCARLTGFLVKAVEFLKKSVKLPKRQRAKQVNTVVHQNDEQIEHSWSEETPNRIRILSDLYSRITQATTDEEKLDIFNKSNKEIGTVFTLRYFPELLNSVSDEVLRSFLSEYIEKGERLNFLISNLETLIRLGFEKADFDKILNFQDDLYISALFSQIPALQKVGYTNNSIFEYLLNYRKKFTTSGLNFIAELAALNLSKNQILQIIHPIIDNNINTGIFSNIEGLRTLGFDDDEIYDVFLRFSKLDYSGYSFKEVDWLQSLNFNNPDERKVKLKALLENMARYDSSDSMFSNLDKIKELGFSVDEIYELLQIFANSNLEVDSFKYVTELAEFFDLNNQVSKNKFYTLLKAMAKNHDSSKIVEKYEFLNSNFSQDEIYELLILSSKNPQFNFANYSGLNLEKFNLSQLQLNNILTNIAKSSHGYWLFVGENITGAKFLELGLSSAQVLELRKQAFLSNPSMFAKKLLGLYFADLPLVTKAPGETSKHSVIAEFLQGKFKIDPEVLIKPVERENVMFGLLQSYGKNYEQLKDKSITHASEILAEALGLIAEQAAALRAARSGDSLSDFYSLALEFSELFPQPKLTQLLDIDPKLFGKKQISKLNTLLGSLIDLASTHESIDDFNVQFDEVIKEFKTIEENQVITTKNIEALQSKLADKISARFSELLGKDSDFSYDKVLALKQKWGDIKEIKVLLARFLGKKSWNGLLKDLGEIFSAELDGNFYKFRFTGITEARKAQVEAQIGHLNTGQRDLWQDAHTRSRLQVVAGDKADSYKFIKAKLKEVPGVIEQLIANANPGNKEVVKEDPLANVEFESVFIKISEGHSFEDKQLVLVLAEKLKSQVTTMNSKIEKLTDDEEVLKFLRSELPNLQEYAKEFKKLINQSKLTEDVKTQLKNDISSIANKFNEVNAADKKEPVETIVFTTIVSDARTMSRIGDCVATSSCQNYRVGGQIHTLPGYIKDPNIQAILSFNLRKKDFPNTADYNAVKEAMNSGEINKYYDGDKMEVVFKFQDAEGSDIEIRVSKPLANYRRLIKLGEFVDGDKAPGSLLETSYTQNNIVQNEQEVFAIAADLENDMGITRKVPKDGKVLLIKKSTGSMGQYSDLAGGTKIEDYQVAN